MPHANVPTSDSSQGADESVFSQSHDRRRVLRFGTVAAGTAILTPTILTLSASPASASGTKFAGDFETTFASTNTSRTVALAVNTVDAKGLYIAVFGIAENISGSPAATFTTPGGWTKIGQTGTDSAAFGSALSVAVFVTNAVYDEDLEEFVAPTITFTYSGGRTGTVSRPRVLSITQFRNATVANSSSAAAFGTLTSSTSQNTGNASVIINNSALYMANVRLAGETPAVTFPVSSNTGSFGDAGANQKIAASSAVDFPAGGYAIGTASAQTITLGSAVLGVSVAVAIG